MQSSIKGEWSAITKVKVLSPELCLIVALGHQFHHPETSIAAAHDIGEYVSDVPRPSRWHWWCKLAGLWWKPWWEPCQSDRAEVSKTVQTATNQTDLSSKNEHKKGLLGLPCLEYKVVQKGIYRILGAIYEQDVLDCSYGFRPNRNCRDTLRAVDQAIMKRPVR